MKSLRVTLCLLALTGSPLLAVKSEETAQPKSSFLRMEELRLSPGAWILEQKCPDPSWWNPSPSSDWASLEIGLSYTWQGPKPTLNPYTRYSCPQGLKERDH